MDSYAHMVGHAHPKRGISLQKTDETLLEAFNPTGTQYEVVLGRLQ